MLILKHFKKQGKCENCLPERKFGNKILLKMEGFLEPKNSKDENFEEFKLFEKLKLGKSFEN